MDLNWLAQPCRVPDADLRAAAEDHQRQLTKPAGSLGRLEQLAIELAALQGTLQPAIERVHITIFAADHGVAAAGVSAFPQVVTAQMIRNFANGGGAVNVLARLLEARLTIVNLGTAQALETLPGVREARLGPGSANFLEAPALTVAQLGQALALGAEAAAEAQRGQAQLFIGGEMGIANTTCAAALACALLALPPAQLAGPGTGLDPTGVARKITVIEQALARHQPQTPLEALHQLGGFELAALTGAYIACGQRGLPVLVDGYITSVAALLALRLRPDLRPWLLFSHLGAEPGHRLVLQAMQAEPLLALELRLGEASGAALAVPLLRCACALHNQMASFAQAGVASAS